MYIYEATPKMQDPLNWENRRKWTNAVLINIQAMILAVFYPILAVRSQNVA